LFGLSFTISAIDVRRTLYENFQVTEAVCDDRPIYLVVCRICANQVDQVPRVAEDINASPVLRALIHKAEHRIERAGLASDPSQGDPAL
jgi:hypothetical protein